MGLEFGHLNPRAASDIVFQQFPIVKSNLGPELGTESMMQLANIFRGDMSQREGWGWHELARWELFFKTLEEIGQVKNPVDLGRVITNEFVGPANRLRPGEGAGGCGRLCVASRHGGGGHRRHPCAVLRQRGALSGSRGRAACRMACRPQFPPDAAQLIKAGAGKNREQGSQPAPWDRGEAGMSENVRILVIGAGNMGTSHAKAYDKIDGFELVGLMSRDHPCSRRSPGRT